MSSIVYISQRVYIYIAIHVSIKVFFKSESHFSIHSNHLYSCHALIIFFQGTMVGPYIEITDTMETCQKVKR